MKTNRTRRPLLIIAIVVAVVATTTTTGVAADTVEVDTSPPETTVDYPRRHEAIPRDWGEIVFGGHASDDQGLANVQLTIQDRVTRHWFWSGQPYYHFRPGWPGPDHFIGTDPPSGSRPPHIDTNWDTLYDPIFVPPGRYRVFARAIDEAGNRDPTPTWVPFTVVGPELAVQLWSTGNGHAGEARIEGRATGDELTQVKIAIVNRSSRRWLQADGTFGPRIVLHRADLQPDDHHADINGIYVAQWSVTKQLPAGQYGISVRAIDDRGGAERIWERFTLESLPNSRVSTPQHRSTVPATELRVLGDAYAARGVDVDRVRVAVVDRATKLWLQPDSTFGTRFVLHDTTVDFNTTSDGLTRASWGWEPDLKPGSYALHTRAYDELGNVEPKPRPWVIFTVT